MSDPSRCPDARALQQAALGDVPPDQLEELARHLESCDRCSSTLHSLAADDSLIDAVRAARSGQEPPQREFVEKLMHNLARLRRVQPEGGDATIQTDFLSPPEGPGEIGRLGGYRVLRVLGSGGMGVVLEAEDVQLRRRVALKVLHPALAASGSYRQRFLREAQAIARLQHDHIVAIHQVGEDRGLPFLAMPLLDGETLDDRLKREGRLPPGEVLRIGREMAEGLAAAHGQGLVHRDVKPGNVWLEGEGGRVKLLDFGLARAADDPARLTREGMILGTPAYMSPEQARGQAADHRSDLFSLGSVLYRAATGAQPFSGPDTQTLLLAVANDVPKPPRAVNPQVPPPLSDLILRLLAKDPAKRPESAREVVDAVRGVEREIATPAPARRSRRPVVVAVGLAALAAAAAVVLGVVLLLQTPDGTLRVEVADKDVEARVKDGELRLYDAEGNLKYTLKPSEKNRTLPPGEYRIEVTGADGLKLSTDRFEMRKNGQVTVRVLLDPAAVAAKEADADRRVAEWLLRDKLVTWVTVAVDGRGVDVAAVEQLPPGPFKITWIMANVPGLTENDLEKLRGLTSLVSLNLEGVDVSDAGLEHLASMPLAQSLEGIGIRGRRVTDVGLAHLKKFPRLRHCTILNCDLTDAGMKQLSQLPDLKGLVLSGRLTDAGLRELRGLNLVSLKFSSKDVTDAGLDAVLAMPDLNDLDLSQTSVSDAGLARLKSHPVLQRLMLDGTKVTDKGLVHLKAQPELRELSLTHTPGTDEGTKTLAELPKLQVLILHGLPITDAGLAALKEARQLQHLSLRDTPVTDAGLVHLKGLDNLAVLNLHRTQVGDAGLEQLKGMKGLVNLDVGETKVTAAGVKRLAAALPGCTITSDHGNYGPLAAAPADREKPFVLLREGKPAGEFKTLPGALAELRPGDEVEVRGDGPFKIGTVKVEGQGLTLRAAAGYRPRLEMAESVGRPEGESVWFTVRGGALTVEGCDLVGTSQSFFFRHSGGPMLLRRCRILRCFNMGVHEAGPGVRLEDCFVHCVYGIGVQAPKALVEFEGNAGAVYSGLVYGVLGGSTVRLHGNTFQASDGPLFHVYPGEAGQPVTFDVANNVLVSARNAYTGAAFWVYAPDWQPLVRWQGHDNLYAGPFAPLQYRSPDGMFWKVDDTAGWDKLVAGEKGSRQVERVSFAWNEMESPTSPGGVAALRKALEEARRNPTLSDVGPDLGLLGPGDAYLRAVEKASGQAIPKDRLRQEAEEGGPFVLLRGGKVVRGFNTLQEAITAAVDGDAVEVRTDGPRPAGTVPAGKGALTLRAAPGYRPVLTGSLTVEEKNALSLEGLEFRDALSFAENAGPVRFANCSFDGAVGLSPAEGKPVEVVKCVVNALTVVVQGPDRKVTVRGSVVNVIALPPQDGEGALVLEHSAVWHPAPGVALMNSGNGGRATAVTARATLFEAPSSLVGQNVLLRWDGAGNVYRVGSVVWQYGGTPDGLPGWRKQFQTAEEGSINADPLLDDPRLWRLTTPEQFGKGFGADVDRVAR